MISQQGVGGVVRAPERGGGRVGRRKIGFWRRLAVSIIKPTMTAWTRRTWSGMEHIPADGPVIIVPNHLSQFDPLVCAHFVFDAGRWPQFLGKAGVFRLPVVGAVLHRIRQIPVERGSTDAARSLDQAIAALRDGGCVIIYPEGTTTREPQLWPMRGKTGVARLALLTGAPVVPVAMWGPQEVHNPVTHRFSLRPRTPVSVAAGAPVDLSRWAGARPTREALDEIADAIMLRVRDLLAELRGGTPPPLFDPPDRVRTRPTEEVTE